MKLLDAMVKEFDIRLAIHNHGPEDKKFPSPYDVWTAVEPYDKRIGLCIDVGHTARAKVDPAEAIRKCRERLYDCHLKDIDSTAPDGKTIEAGRGVLDLKSILRALLDVRYRTWPASNTRRTRTTRSPGCPSRSGTARASWPGWRSAMTGGRPGAGRRPRCRCASVSALAAAADRPPIVGVSHIAFQVSDVARARAFYGGLLGYDERARGQGVVGGGALPDQRPAVCRDRARPAGGQATIASITSPSRRRTSPPCARSSTRRASRRRTRCWRRATARCA